MGFRNPANFACGIGNPSALNPECSSRKYPYPSHGGQLKFRREGGSKGRNFRANGRWLFEVFFRWFRVRLVSCQKLTAALLSKLSDILLLTSFKTRIFVFISDILFKVGKFGIQYLDPGVHSVESRIQDCFGFPSMARLRYLLNWEKR